MVYSSSWTEEDKDDKNQSNTLGSGKSLKKKITANFSVLEKAWFLHSSLSIVNQTELMHLLFEDKI